MLADWKRQWREFRRGRPGQRFEARYERSQKARSTQAWYGRLLKPVVALVLFAGGVVLCFIPGPGIPLIIIGAGLFADLSRPVARGLDWLEVRARKILAWSRRWWHGASLIAREAVIAAAVLIACGAAYGGYRFIASH